MNEENKLDKRKWEKPELKTIKVQNTQGGDPTGTPETTTGGPGPLAS